MSISSIILEPSLSVGHSIVLSMGSSLEPAHAPKHPTHPLVCGVWQSRAGTIKKCPYFNYGPLNNMTNSNIQTNRSARDRVYAIIYAPRSAPAFGVVLKYSKQLIYPSEYT